MKKRVYIEVSTKEVVSRLDEVSDVKDLGLIVLEKYADEFTEKEIVENALDWKFAFLVQYMLQLSHKLGKHIVFRGYVEDGNIYDMDGKRVV